jgi:hypothetical protein
LTSKKDKGKGKIDSKALVLKPKSTLDVLYVVSKTDSSSSMVSYVPPIQLPPIYIPLLTVQYLFSIEKNHSHNKSPKELALSYFPLDFHWIPDHP